MAKQSGIHQLRGKVGEHSYYRQTGISSGLVRSINQGMSSRVKNGEEYANTRLNNVEFGGACSVAGALGDLVVPKFRPMILPFSQSKMAKAILDLARQTSLPWGKRVVSSGDTPQICDILTSTSKLQMSNFCELTFTRNSETQLEVEAAISASQATQFASLGINSLSFEISVFDLATGKYNNVTGKINKASKRLKASGNIPLDITAGTSESGTVTLTMPQFVPATPEQYNDHRVVVVVMQPMRKIAEVSHVLQEHCCFVAQALPAVEG